MAFYGEVSTEFLWDLGVVSEGFMKLSLEFSGVSDGCFGRFSMGISGDL